MPNLTNQQITQAIRDLTSRLENVEELLDIELNTVSGETETENVSNEKDIDNGATS